MIKMRRFAFSLIVAFLIVCIGLVGFAGEAHAALVFHSGFEMGDFSEWDSVGGSPSVVTILDASSPTDFTDPDTAWSEEANAYDGNTGTYASHAEVGEGVWSSFLQFTVPSGTYSAVRTYTGIVGATADIDIDAYDGGGWTGIYEGSMILAAWAVNKFTSQTVNQIRIRIKPTGISGDPIIWEVEIGSSVKTGDYAMRCNTEAATAYVSSGIDPRRVTVYLYIASTPSAECLIIGATGYLNLRLDTDRHLNLYEGAQMRVSGGTVLDTATWYRISLSLEPTEENACSYYINGELESYIDEIGVNVIGDIIGVMSSCTADLYFDDYVADNTASTDDLGDIRVLRAMPNAAGEYAQYDTSSGYTNVNSWPNSDASFVEDEGADAARESYNIEGTSDLGIGGSDTINAVNVCIRGDRDGGGGTDHMIMVRDDSVDYNSADLDFDGIAWYTWYHAVLPNGGAPWTVDRFNAFEIGAYHLGAQNQRVHSVLAMVAYTPTGVGVEISNTPSSKGFGILEVNTYSDTAINHFTIENTGSGAVDVVVYATDLTGGDDTWDLSDTATPGENIYGLKAGLDDDDDLFDVIVKETEAYNELVNNLLESATQDWGLRIYMPTSVTDYDGQQMSAILTLVCSAH